MVVEYSHVPHTFLLALLISILSVYTPARSLTYPPLFGSDTSPQDTALLSKWNRIFIRFKFVSFKFRYTHDKPTDPFLSPKTRAERALLYPSVLAIFGAWCGAYPLALDWDRPWQVWPLTPAIGAIIGHILGDWNSVLVSTVYYLGRTLEDPRIKRR